MKQVIQKLSSSSSYDFLHQNKKSSSDNRRRQSETENKCFFSGGFKLQENRVWLEPDDTLLERFVIIEFLGHGSIGTVYLAQDMFLRNEVALKVVEVGPLNDDITSLQLKREINIYNQIYDYQYVIRVSDLHYVPWGGTGLLVMSMEHANGGTFRKWLLVHENDLDTRKTTGLEYFKMACVGIATIHDGYVSHLDLKPENLLFKDDILKVSDFGASSCSQRLKQASIFHQQESSQEKGTPVYMSPEHFLAPHPEDIGHQADIYSLGIILFELLHPNCRPPFGGSYDRLRELHLKVPAPRITNIDENLANIVATCLEKAPEDRYQSVWDLLEDLEKGYCSFKGPTNSRETKKNSAHEEIETIMQSASNCFSQGDYNESIRLIDKALSLDPENDAAQQLRTELQTRFEKAEKFYQTIAQNLKDGGLYELAELLKEAVNLFPDHPSGHLIQTKIAIKAADYRNNMEQGLHALQTNNWEEALEFFQKANQHHPNTVNLNPLIEKLNTIKNLRMQINQALINSESEKALTIASIVDDQVDDLKNRIRALKIEEEDEHENRL
ncbi:MAG: protein kinase [Desulfobacteraceae bacterium]|nr:protein kinase [Desulfobacteraceae bacterium]MBC2755153.1 protein kinase [Desulfobacteraceae bacterium]